MSFAVLKNEKLESCRDVKRERSTREDKTNFRVQLTITERLVERMNSTNERIRRGSLVLFIFRENNRVPHFEQLAPSAAKSRQM